LDEIKEKLTGVLDQNLKEVSYNRELDVKKPPVWPNDSSILILYGDSGNGKTWQLANLVLSQNQQQNEEFVVFSRSKGEVDKTLQAAANIVW
jgi:chromosomal replication initiation ATPase DnaA